MFFYCVSVSLLSNLQLHFSKRQRLGKKIFITKQDTLETNGITKRSMPSCDHEARGLNLDNSQVSSPEKEMQLNELKHQSSLFLNNEPYLEKNTVQWKRTLDPATSDLYY